MPPDTSADGAPSVEDHTGASVTCADALEAATTINANPNVIFTLIILKNEEEGAEGTRGLEVFYFSSAARDPDTIVIGFL